MPYSIKNLISTLQDTILINSEYLTETTIDRIINFSFFSKEFKNKLNKNKCGGTLIMKFHNFQNWKKGTIGKAWLYQNQDLKGHFEKRNGLYSFVPDWNNIEKDEDGGFFMGCILEYSPWKKDRKTANLRRKDYKNKLKEKLNELGKPIHTKPQNLNKKKKCKSLGYSSEII